MGALAVISAILGIAGSAYGLYQSYQNQKLNENVSQKNFDLQTQQYEYQKELNEKVMEREDTSFQRQRADLEAAGFSPLMTAGGGASAAPMTASQAPQQDLSGINEAVKTQLGAYNDIFNRSMSRQQFALQARNQTAQLKMQIAESELNQKKMSLENDYLDEKLKWEKTHGFRNDGWQKILTDIALKTLGVNDSSTITDVVNNIKESGTDLVKNGFNGAVQQTKDLFDKGLEVASPVIDKVAPYAAAAASTAKDKGTKTFNYLALKQDKYILRNNPDNKENRKDAFLHDPYLQKYTTQKYFNQAPNGLVEYYAKNGKLPQWYIDDYEKYKKFWSD